MKKKWNTAGRKTGIQAGCFLLAVVFWIFAFHFYRKTETGSCYVNTYYKSPVCTETDINNFLKADKRDSEEALPEITGWLKLEDEGVKSEFREAENITVWKAAGKMEHLFKSSLVHGNYPWEEDENGCVVSTALAEKLFGAEEIQGSEIQIQNDDYIIRGVVKDEEAFAAIKADSTDRFSGVLLKYKDQRHPVSLAREFLFQMTGAYPDGIFEGNLYSALARLMVSLPLWVIGIFCFRKAYKQTNRLASFGLRLPVKLAGMVGFCLLCAVGISISVKFSQDYLPSMWSDMGFFPEIIREKVKTCQDLKDFFLCPRDKKLLAYLWKAGAASMASVLTMVPGAKDILVYWH